MVSSYLHFKNKDFSLHWCRLPVVHRETKWDYKGVLLDVQVLNTSVNKSICSTVQECCGWNITWSSFVLILLCVWEKRSSPRCWLDVPIRCGFCNKIITSSQMFAGDVCRVVTFLRCAIWNPQHFILFLLHDGHDLSANIGDAACLDNACKTVRVWGGRGGVHMGSVKHLYHIWLEIFYKCYIS